MGGAREQRRRTRRDHQARDEQLVGDAVEHDARRGAVRGRDRPGVNAPDDRPRERGPVGIQHPGDGGALRGVVEHETRPVGRERGERHVVESGWSSVARLHPRPAGRIARSARVLSGSSQVSTRSPASSAKKPKPLKGSPSTASGGPIDPSSATEATSTADPAAPCPLQARSAWPAPSTTTCGLLPEAPTTCVENPALVPIASRIGPSHAT
jgi:hypothetical protein